MSNEQLNIKGPTDVYIELQEGGITRERFNEIANIVVAPQWTVRQLIEETINIDGIEWKDDLLQISDQKVEVEIPIKSFNRIRQLVKESGEESISSFIQNLVLKKLNEIDG